MVKVAEEGHDQVVHELIRVGAEVDVQIILINYPVETLIRMQIVLDCVPVNVL